MSRYRKLLSSAKIGSLDIRNRLFLTPMGTNLADEDGYVGERAKRFYERRAEGGAGLLILGSVSVGYPVGSSNVWHIGLSDDKYIPDLKELTDRVHNHGAKVAAQISHQSLLAINDIRQGRPLLAASLPDSGKKAQKSDMYDDLLPEEIQELMAGMGGRRPEVKEATVDDIREVVSLFANAAQRAQRAGFDAVEIHGGHSYLIHNFLNPSSNRRTDEYGGSLENRARLMIEVIQAVRDAVGAGFTVWIRLDAVENLNPDGISAEQALETARMAAGAGVDAIHVTAYGGANNALGPTEGYIPHKPNALVPYAKAMRTASGLPVIAMGRIEPGDAERFLNQGSLDFVTMGRKLLADPDLPNKLAAGEEEQIRPCVYCYTCVSQIFFQRRVICAVNAECGKEFERAIVPADSQQKTQAGAPKKVLVVGGGLAGMEAARVATLRGHKVTLIEASGRLGGAAQFSAVSYRPNGKLVDYLKAELRRLGVAIELNTNVTVANIQARQPDAVIVAIGGENWRPDIPGADLSHVFDGEEMRAMVMGEDGSVRKKMSWFAKTAVGAANIVGLGNNPDLLALGSRLYMPLGKDIVFIGGELVAVELAEFLAERGRRVTLLEEKNACGKGLALVRRWRNIHDIKALGVQLCKGVKDVTIEADRVRFTNAKGEAQEVKVSQVILANSPRARNGLAEEIRAAGVEVVEAGDCTGMGYIEGAMHDGYAAGLAV